MNGEIINMITEPQEATLARGNRSAEPFWYICAISSTRQPNGENPTYTWLYLHVSKSANAVKWSTTAARAKIFTSIEEAKAFNCLPTYNNQDINIYAIFVRQRFAEVHVTHGSMAMAEDDKARYVDGDTATTLSALMTTADLPLIVVNEVDEAKMRGVSCVVSAPDVDDNQHFLYKRADGVYSWTTDSLLAKRFDSAMSANRASFKPETIDFEVFDRINILNSKIINIRSLQILQSHVPSGLDKIFPHVYANGTIQKTFTTPRGYKSKTKAAAVRKRKPKKTDGAVD